MATTSGVHTPPPFLSCPGEPSTDWRAWLTAFDTYLTTSGLNAAEVRDEQKRALLLHCIGMEGQRIFATLGTSETYKEARERLTQFFGKSKDVVVERYKFRQRHQRQGESAREYVSALRELAVTCRFGELHDELVRDQLIKKTIHPKVRERLLMESDDMSCDKALNLASQIEQVLYESKKMEVRREFEENFDGLDRETDVKDTLKGNVIGHVRRVQSQGRASTRSSSILTCGNCGLPHQQSRASCCPAFGKECRKCGKANHFARCCRGLTYQRLDRQSAVNMLNDTSSQESQQFTILNMIGDVSPGKFKKLVCVLGKSTISLVVDLGAKVSVLNQHTCSEFLGDCSVSPSSMKLVSYEGCPIKVIGEIHIPVQCGKHKLGGFSFYVTSSGANIMGVYLFDALGFQIVQDDLTQRKEPILQVVSKWQSEWPSLFTGLGCVKEFAHRPIINPDVKSVVQSLRQIPLALRDEVSLELK